MDRTSAARAARDAHVRPRRRVAVDLPRGDERVDAPVGHHAEDVSLEQLQPLLGLDLPRAHIDEPVLLETPEEDLTAEAGLIVERHIVADGLQPVEARRPLQKENSGTSTRAVAPSWPNTPTPVIPRATLPVSSPENPTGA